MAVNMHLQIQPKIKNGYTTSKYRCQRGIVGTGNKVEDFGVGFYTKYGDGGVDIQQQIQ